MLAVSPGEAPDRKASAAFSRGGQKKVNICLYNFLTPMFRMGYANVFGGAQNWQTQPEALCLLRRDLGKRSESQEG